jgi:hypothetical protein
VVLPTAVAQTLRAVVALPHVIKAVLTALTKPPREVLRVIPEGVRAVTPHIPDQAPEVMEATLLAQELVVVVVVGAPRHITLNPDSLPPLVPFRVMVIFMAVVQTAAGRAQRGMLEIPETPAMRQLLLQLIV